MQKHFKIRKGLNIRIKGKPQEQTIETANKSQVYAIYPSDFPGLTPKPIIKEGMSVKAGTALFYHKDMPEIKIASPVSGILKQIQRGERRVIERFIIEADNDIEYENFDSLLYAEKSREEIIKYMVDTCVWPFVRQRPYNIIANPNDKPRDIFISGFDSSPLAPNINYVLKGNEGYLQEAINVLSKLTDGKIYVGLNGDAEKSIFENIKGIEINYFSGPHPAGNVGVQIHHINPINKGDIIWVINPADLLVIGKLFMENMYDVSRTIAVSGSEVNNPLYVKTIQGAEISSICKDVNNENELRNISGNVLTGTNMGNDGHLGFYDNMITIIPEGNYYEFMGWALPGFNKYSLSRTYFSWLNPKKEYKLDSNYHGGERAFVFTGEYERVVPMDILPQHLIKAIMIEDIDLMENLGIYEVVEEDLALCDFVCASKIEVQHILRKGLNLMIKELS